MNNKVILIIGATGNQGGAVIKALQKTNFKIRALVRATPKSSKSNKVEMLRSQGVEIALGNLDDRASLVNAMRGVWGVFSVINNMDGGVKKEEERGKRVADVAKQAGVKHFVYSSVGGAERQSGVPHFESKWHIEKYIREIGLPYSVVRPTAFMVNLMEAPLPLRFFMLSMYHGMKRPLQMIDVEDIGKWVAHILLSHNKYLGKAVEIAGDEISYSQIIRAYQRIYGKKPRSIKFPIALFAVGDLGKMFNWLDKHGYRADIPALRKEIPDILTYERFIAKREIGAKF